MRVACVKCVIFVPTATPRNEKAWGTGAPALSISLCDVRRKLLFLLDTSIGESAMRVCC